MKKYALIFFISVLLQGCSDDPEVSSRTQQALKVKSVVQGKVTAPIKASDERDNVDAVSYQFVELSVQQLEKALSIGSSRIYAYIEFNAPSVVLNLPKNENSAFAEISFKNTKTLNEKGDDVKHEVIRGLYDTQYFSKAIRFADPQNREKPLVFDKVVGNVSVNYPLVISVEKFTRTMNAKRGITVEIDKNTVIVRGDFDALAGRASFSLSRSPVSVFNASGELLKPKNGTIEWAFNGEIKLPFEQEPKEVHIAFTEKQHMVDLPYQLEPVALLPKATRGIRPE